MSGSRRPNPSSRLTGYDHYAAPGGGHYPANPAPSNPHSQRSGQSYGAQPQRPIPTTYPTQPQYGSQPHIPDPMRAMSYPPAAGGHSQPFRGPVTRVNSGNHMCGNDNAYNGLSLDQIFASPPIVIDRSLSTYNAGNTHSGNKNAFNRFSNRQEYDEARRSQRSNASPSYSQSSQDPRYRNTSFHLDGEHNMWSGNYGVGNTLTEEPEQAYGRTYTNGRSQRQRRGESDSGSDHESDSRRRTSGSKSNRPRPNQYDL